MAPLIADGGTTSANLGQAPNAKVAVLCLGQLELWPHQKPRARQVGVREGFKGRAMAVDCPRAKWTLKPRDMANNVVGGCWEQHGQKRSSDSAAAA
jgi:hypothetical protein